MLVVDGNALQTVDRLNFVKQVPLHRVFPHDSQNVVRVDGAFAQTVARPHAVAFVDPQMLAQWNHVFMTASLVVAHDDLPVSAFGAAEFDDAVGFGNHRRVLGPARFEQLGHAGQTAGNVLAFTRFARNFDDDVALGDDVVFAHLQISSRRRRDAGESFAIIVENLNAGMEFFLAMLHHHHVADSRAFVVEFANGFALNQIDQFDFSGLIGKNDVIIGVPFEQ